MNNFNSFILNLLTKVTKLSDQKDILNNFLIEINNFDTDVKLEILNTKAKKSRKTIEVIVNTDNIYQIKIISNLQDKSADIVALKSSFELLNNFFKHNLQPQDDIESESDDDRFNKSFKDLIESSSTPIFIIRNSIIKYANSSGLKITGYTKKELIGKSTSILHISKEMFEKADNEILEALKNNNQTFLEYPFKDKSGKIGYFEINISLLPNGDIVSFCNNITEAKKSKKSINFQSQILEQIKDSIVTFNLNGKIIHWNTGSENLFIYKKKEIIGSDISILFNEKDHLYPNNEYLSTSLLSDQINFETVLSRKNGSKFFAQLSHSTIKNSDGKTIAFVLFIVDISGKIITENALKKSEEKFRALFEGTSNSIFFIDNDRIKYVNESGLKSYGYSKKELHNKSTRLLSFSDEDYKEFKRVSNAGLANDGYWHDEWTFRKKNGEVIWIDCFMTKLKSGGIVSIEHDITAKKNAQDELQKQKEQYKTVLESSHSYVIITKNKIIQFVNNAAALAFGYTAKELIGQEVQILHETENTYNLLKIEIDATLANSNYWQGEKPYLSKNGTLIWTNTIISKMLNGSRIVVAHDITEKKKLDDALKEIVSGKLAITGKDFFAKVTNYFTSFLKVDYAFIGELDEVNNSIKMLSFNHNEKIIENQIFNIKNSASEYVLDNGFLMCENKTSSRFPLNSNFRNFEINGYSGIALTSNDKNIGIFSVMTKDKIPNPDFVKSMLQIFSVRISAELDRISSEKNRILLEKQLYQSQKMESIGRLAGGIAHEFNNILVSIMGYAEMLKSKYPESDSFEGKSSKIILQSANKASDLTNQLLGFARGGRYNPIPLNVNYAIEDSIKVHNKIIDNNIEVSLNLEKNIAKCLADRSQIDQVLSNIIVNSIDAMPNGGHLFITTTNYEVSKNNSRKHFDLVNGNYVQITISDTGKGMDDKVLKNIFDPFFTTKPKTEGTGLGLATVYGIIKNHDGIIKAKSEVGKGTIIEIFLPFTDRTSEAKKVPNEVIKGTGLVLIIDDEENVRYVTTQIVKSIGYDVIVAKSGKEGINIFKERSKEISVVILDVIMPEMGGKDTYIGLMKVDPKLCVLISSGYSINDEIIDILDLGANEFIQKPFSMKELSVGINNALT